MTTEVVDRSGWCDTRREGSRMSENEHELRCRWQGTDQPRAIVKREPGRSEGSG